MQPTFLSRLSVKSKPSFHYHHHHQPLSRILKCTRFHTLPFFTEKSPITHSRIFFSLSLLLSLILNHEINSKNLLPPNMSLIYRRHLRQPQRKPLLLRHLHSISPQDPNQDRRNSNGEDTRISAPYRRGLYGVGSGTGMTQKSQKSASQKDEGEGARAKGLAEEKGGKKGFF